MIVGTVRDPLPLAPALTAFDKRVLSKLDTWDLYDDASPHWRNAWQVAELLREEDVAMVRRVLDGLVEFRHAWPRHWGYRRQWVAKPSGWDD